VSCRCAGVTVREALDGLLARTSLTFREMQGQIVVLPASGGAPLSGGDAPSGGESTVPGVAATITRSIEPATIIGTAFTEGRTPIGGALVTIPSLRFSTTTNDAGEYRIAVPTERVSTRPESLHVTRIGYRPATARFELHAGDVRVDVVMSQAVVALDRVVVTGTLGNQQHKSQPAVVATIDAADIVAKAPILGITELLAARTPGVSITTASGTTGAASRISIRGQASLNLSNRPLVFIDGIKISSGPRSAASSVGGQQLDGLSDLNPDDVESIEIVKGPAAAALYGADASAGVIQILTKKGRAGSRSFTQRVTTEYDDIDPNFTPATNYYKCLTADIAATSTSRKRAVGSSRDCVPWCRVA
jgi:TonB-dependent SusC/RagA subfamily outer membrane receptor